MMKTSKLITSVVVANFVTAIIGVALKRSLEGYVKTIENK